MKSFLAMLLTVIHGVACGITPEQLVKRRPAVTASVQPRDSDSTLYLRTAFNDAEILGKTRVRLLSGRSIRKITLYYSSYRLSDQFDQPALNLMRFRALHAVLPEAFGNAVVQWSIVAQTGAATPDEARRLFHGFVIEFIPGVDMESMRAELTYLEKITHNDSLGRDSISYVDKCRVRKRVQYTGRYLPVSRRKRMAGITYSRRGIWNRKRQQVSIADTLCRRVAIRHFIPSPVAHTYIRRHITDSTVLAVFNRNRHWDSMALVVDITGSMSPYTSQLMVWFKLNVAKRPVKSFVFFNDGNEKPDNQKIVGRTGGLFFVKHTHPDVVIAEALKAMSRGAGGDSPENNCEALIMAQQQDPGVKEIFMIADNFAPVRDMQLLSRITKPVRIILCGVYEDRFHTDYLNIARSTGGSVHSLTRDIDYLAGISERRKFTIGETTYVVRNGRVELAE